MGPAYKGSQLVHAAPIQPACLSPNGNSTLKCTFPHMYAASCVKPWTLLTGKQTVMTHEQDLHSRHMYLCRSHSIHTYVATLY